MTDNMKIWDAVAKTNPAYTKKVTQRGGFTAIAASYQIMEATRQFGPLGVGWGYSTGETFFHDNLMFVPVTIWHTARENTFGPIVGCAEWKNPKGYLDSAVSKKATTDAITKGLSQLGFNADVFLGKFDDNKYVAEMTKEFAAKPEPTPQSVISFVDNLRTATDKAAYWTDHFKSIPAEWREFVNAEKEKMKETA